MAARIGILALQGDVREHGNALGRLGVETRLVRLPEHVDGLDGLVLPGGESTTLGKLMAAFGLSDAIRERVRAGRMGLLATCAGMILAASEIDGSDQPRLGLLDMRVRRNAFGRQRESFSAAIPIPALGEETFPAVFIRAPYVVAVGDEVETLAAWEGHPVLVASGRVMAAAFHPELTENPIVHRAFIERLGLTA